VGCGQNPSEDLSAQRLLAAAYAAHLERFPRGPVSVRPLPTEVWIDEPAIVLPSGIAVPTPTRDASAIASQPGAQAGSTAAEGRAQRSVVAAEHPATTSAVAALPLPATESPNAH
jgi:hypothetical protein